MCCCYQLQWKMWRMLRVEPRTDWNSNDGAEQTLLNCVSTSGYQVTSSWVSGLRMHHFSVLHIRSPNGGSALLADLLWTDGSILRDTSDADFSTGCAAHRLQWVVWTTCCLPLCPLSLPKTHMETSNRKWKPFFMTRATQVDQKTNPVTSDSSQPGRPPLTKTTLTSEVPEVQISTK